MALLPISNRCTTPHARKVWYQKVREFAPKSVWMPTSNTFNYKKWTTIIITEIKGLYKKGVPLTSNFIRDNHTKLWRSGVHVFSNWPNAVSACQLTDKRGRVVEGTNLLVTDHPKRMAIIKQMQEDVKNGVRSTHELHMLARSHFIGGWQEAMDDAGIPYVKEKIPKPEE